MLYQINRPYGRGGVALALLLALVPLVLLVFVTPALAATDVAPQPPGDVVTGVNVWLLLIGQVTPLVGYLLNHYAPWASEQAKALIQAALAAGSGAVYQALSDGNFGWNTQTLVAVLTVMGSAVIGHVAYKQGGINAFLGAGRNADGKPPAQKTLV